MCISKKSQSSKKSLPFAPSTTDGLPKFLRFFWKYTKTVAFEPRLIKASSPLPANQGVFIRYFVLIQRYKRQSTFSLSLFKFLSFLKSPDDSVVDITKEPQQSVTDFETDETFLLVLINPNLGLSLKKYSPIVNSPNL